RPRPASAAPATAAAALAVAGCGCRCRRMVRRMRRRTSAAAATAAALEATPRLEPRATLLREAPPLVRRWVDLGHEHVVLGPLDGNLLTDELLDCLQIQRARLVHQADGAAGGAGARRATDAVHVILGILRQVPVDHVADRLDVQAARRHVGRYE